MTNQKLDTHKAKEQAAHWQAEQHRLLGAVVRLAQYSELHRQYPLAFFASRFGTAIKHNRFRCLENDRGELLAFCAWAYISPETVDRVRTQGHDPQPDEWYGHGTLFFKEFIAPFGHAKLLVSDLRRNVFPNESNVYGLRGRIGPLSDISGKRQVRHFNPRLNFKAK